MEQMASTSFQLGRAVDDFLIPIQTLNDTLGLSDGWYSQRHPKSIKHLKSLTAYKS